VPSCFIAGGQDWGIYQAPGEFEHMRSVVCTHVAGCPLIEGAGRRVQQEQPEVVVSLLLQFLDAN
jgi:hypothetical protein